MANLPPSAINTSASKNKKKRDKKKAKKQAAAGEEINNDSTTQSEISSPTLTDKENIEPTTAATSTAATSTAATSTAATSKALPADPIVASPLNGTNNTSKALPADPIVASPLNGTNNTSDANTVEPATSAGSTEPLIQNESLTASALPAQPIQEPTTTSTNISAAGPVGVGAAAVGTASKSSATGTTSSVPAPSAKVASTASSLSAPLPLSENVQHCIKSIIASGCIDLMSIVKNIQQKVAAGDYKAEAALPATANKNVTSATPVKSTIAPQSSVDQPTKAQQTGTVKAMPPPPITKDNKMDTATKAAVGAGAGVAGAGAAVAGAVKSDGKPAATTEPKTTTNISTTTSKMTSAAATAPGAVSSETAKLSENVQHCIKSVVNAPAVDVYGILDSSTKVKRPEPAVGGPTQPTMPSSTKTADNAPPPTNTKKGKSSEHHRKSPLASLKKINCIIL